MRTRCRVRRFGSTLFSLALAACGGGGSGVPNDLLAFVADGRDAGTFEVFLAAPGGVPWAASGPLVPGSSAAVVAWSPDRRHLAFLSDRDDPASADLFVVDVESGAVTNLTTALADPVADYVWSPAASHVAVVTLAPGFLREIHAIPIDGGAPVLLTQAGGIQDGQSVHVAWRPQGPGDAPSLAYTGDPEVLFQRDLYLVNADGTGHVRLNARGGGVAASAQVSRVNWAPDGSRLAYVYDPIAFADRLFVTDGGPSGELSGLGAAADRAVESYAWSPDSTRLGFIANGGAVAAADLYLVPPSGGPPLPVTAHASGIYLSQFWWAPDGSRLAHSSFTGNAAPDSDALHVYTLAGGSDVVVHPHGVFGVAWRPAGDRLAFMADGLAPGDPAESIRIYVSDLVAPGVDAIGDLPLDGAIDATNPFWDPLGQRVLFRLSPAVGNDGLHVVPASGAPRLAVSEPAETVQLLSNGGAAWSASGAYVAYRPEEPGDQNLRPLRLRNVTNGALIDALGAFGAGAVSGEFAWR